MLWKLPRTSIGGTLAALYVTHLASSRSLMASLHSASCDRFLSSTYAAAFPLLLTFASSNTAGTTKKVVTTSAMVIGYSIGNIIAPLLFKGNEAPEYISGRRAFQARAVPRD